MKMTRRIRKKKTMPIQCGKPQKNGQPKKKCPRVQNESHMNANTIATIIITVPTGGRPPAPLVTPLVAPVAPFLSLVAPFVHAFGARVLARLPVGHLLRAVLLLLRRRFVPGPAVLVPRPAAVPWPCMRRHRAGGAA